MDIQDTAFHSDNSHYQYIKTIGKLEASYVIRKFLDAQRIHNLTKYLQALHKAQQATEEHTTLLLNCYTKLKDVNKLDEFIMLDEKIAGGRPENVASNTAKYSISESPPSLTIKSASQSDVATYFVVSPMKRNGIQFENRFKSRWSILQYHPDDHFEKGKYDPNDNAVWSLPRNNSGKFFLNKYASAITRLNSNNHITLDQNSAEVAFESRSDRLTNDSDNDSDPDDWTAGRRIYITNNKYDSDSEISLYLFFTLFLAYLDAGMGPVQTVNFVTALNIPCISPNNLKAREREIGKTIEEYARSSCKKALEEEYLMNRTNEEDTELDKSLDVSFDGGWQKRGSGRSYNSTTGHATVIGNVSGKCLHFGLKSTDCRKCNYIDEKGDASEEEHDCRRNYLGSSKAMEPALAVEMVKDIEEMGYMVNSLTMDDDTTTMARLRQEVDHDVIKRSDSNHFRKNFTGDLLQLHQKHKRSISTT
ncbi:unnamed protein product [Mytilus edulis]|uniref:Mutator-like transposase domain-containing protein n=1 Tax=Mytilus edulis TaxID=6550 RepID=A0A8S3QLY7_MYTED|nr:unnamed protein product [Mytilus edulis]